MLGNADDDILKGNDGSDVLQGGHGNDLLVGGAGADVLWGQDGADTFRFTAVTDAGLNHQADNIMDFQSGTDQISLQALSGTPLTLQFGGDLDGSSPTVLVKSREDGLRLFVDIDQDGIAEMRINLIGTYSITSEDFVL